MLEGSLDPSGPAWADAAAQAGFHPASLALCCQGRHLTLLEPLKRSAAWARLGFQLVPALNFETIVAWSPLTYAPGVDGWTLRARGAALADDLLAVSPLALEGNALRVLGDGWEIVGGLQVADLPALERLGDRLEINGDLVLSGLPRLAQLGAGLRIHGNLTLADCPELRVWPEDLDVRGAVWTDRPVAGAPAALAERIRCPWPGLAPAPRAVAITSAGARELATA
jgi:hypothetical protein